MYIPPEFVLLLFKNWLFFISNYYILTKYIILPCIEYDLENVLLSITIFLQFDTVKLPPWIIPFKFIKLVSFIKTSLKLRIPNPAPC